MRYKMIVVSLLITAAMLSGIYISVDAIMKDNTYRGTKKTLLNEMSLAGSLVEEYLLQSPLSYGVDPIADTVSKDLGVRVTIAGRYGTVVGDSGLDGEKLRSAENILRESEVRDALRYSFGEATIEGTIDGKRMLSFASTFGRSSPVGIIRFSLPLSSAYYVSESARIRLGVTMLTAMAVFMAAILIVSRAASRRSAAKLEEMDLSNEAPVSLLPESEQLVRENPILGAAPAAGSVLVLRGVRKLNKKQTKKRHVARRRAIRIKRKRRSSGKIKKSS